MFAYSHAQPYGKIKIDSSEVPSEVLWQEGKIVVSTHGSNLFVHMLFMCGPFMGIFDDGFSFILATVFVKLCIN